MKSNLCSFVLFCIIFHASFTFLLLSTKVSGLGSSSTIAISYRSGTICGILAGKFSQTIQCFQQGETFSMLPNISYKVISGGKDFFCGLSSSGSELFCWDTRFSNASLQGERIYHNSTFPLSEISVGHGEVCALQARTGIIHCWERDRFFALRTVLTRVAGIHLDSITSGEGFFCGIVKNHRYVICWGESGMGDFIEDQFGSMSMLSLVAGESHVCGIAMSGALICKGNNPSGQLNVPSRKPFYYSELALGRKYICALQRSNGRLACWGDGWQISESEFAVQLIEILPFNLITAGMDFICGLLTDTLTTLCWGPGWSSKFDHTLPLETVIPGPCLRDPCRICGIFPGSESLCGEDTNICMSCMVEFPLSLQSEVVFQKRSFEVAQPAPPPIETISSSPPPKEGKMPIWAYEIFGLVGIISGLFALSYFIYLKKPRSCDGKVQHGMEKELRSVGSSNVDRTFVVASNASSAPQSRSSSITQLSSLTSGRQRSCDLSSKHVEKAEIFTLMDLAAATKNFSLENKIGRGSFGTVYRGKLVDDREVAIKREEICTRKERENAFEVELTLLSRVHHKHLVSLIGYCEETERLLVYEYMSNGALHDHLHIKNDTEMYSSQLNSWDMRIKIALDAARGIEYLHNYAVPPIIHRDIKSSNILLDAKWVARVSDFGLSMKGPENEEGSMPIKAVGTVGYIDPEYYVLKVLTTKSDVYGFGVVLLELLTGKKAVFKEKEGDSPIGVVEYAVPFIGAGELWKVLDRRVHQPLMNESEAIELFAYTAMMCVNLEGKDRPTMSDIVTNLERAWGLCKCSFGNLPSTSYSCG